MPIQHLHGKIDMDDELLPRGVIQSHAARKAVGVAVVKNTVIIVLLCMVIINHLDLA